MLINGLAASGIAVVFLLFYFRYFLGLAYAFTKDKSQAVLLIDELFSGSGQNGVLAFNVFIDFFLCTVFMFFLHYRPKRVFTGRKLMIFRALSILPILYEAVSLVLKYLSVENTMTVPAVLVPFLTTKPAIMFILFIILAVFIKNRERVFCMRGKTHAEYKQFLKTNRNSLHFSIFTAILFLIAGLIDLGLSYLLTDSGNIQMFNLVYSLGIGNSVALIFLAPVVLLFSYTRKYKNKLMDLITPVIGVILIVLVYLEAAYQALSRLFISGFME